MPQEPTCYEKIKACQELLHNSPDDTDRLDACLQEALNCAERADAWLRISALPEGESSFTPEDEFLINVISGVLGGRLGAALLGSIAPSSFVGSLAAQIPGAILGIIIGSIILSGDIPDPIKEANEIAASLESVKELLQFAGREAIQFESARIQAMQAYTTATSLELMNSLFPPLPSVQLSESAKRLILALAEQAEFNSEEDFGVKLTGFDLLDSIYYALETGGHLRGLEDVNRAWIDEEILNVIDQGEQALEDTTETGKIDVQEQGFRVNQHLLVEGALQLGIIDEKAASVLNTLATTADLFIAAIRASTAAPSAPQSTQADAVSPTDAEQVPATTYNASDSGFSPTSTGRMPVYSSRPGFSSTSTGFISSGPVDDSEFDTPRRRGYGGSSPGFGFERAY